MSNPMSKQELGHTQTPEAGEIIDYIDAAAEKIYSAYSTLLSRVSQLESDCRRKDEALRNAETVFMIVQPRSHTKEYLEALDMVRAALSPAPQPDTTLDFVSVPRSLVRDIVNLCDEGAASGEHLAALDAIQMIARPAITGDQAPQPDAVQADETAWLIEFSEKVSRTPAYYGHTGKGLGETTVSLKAVRFARREDAQAIIDDIGWNEARPVEHMWTDSKCCNGLSPEECAQVPGRHCDGLQPASPPPAHDVIERDARRYRRLQVLGVAPYGSKHLDNGTVLRFTGLDAFVDEDMRHYKRGDVPLPAANLLRQSAPVDRETTQTLLDLLNPLHGSLDEQTYDEKSKANFDTHPDDEYAVNVTSKQERDLTHAVLILEKRLKDAPASAPAEAAGMPREAVEQLTNHQEQCDFDGIMVKVSRQALDEVLEYVRALPIPESTTDAAVKALVEAVILSASGLVNGKPTHWDENRLRAAYELAKSMLATLAANGVK